MNSDFPIHHRQFLQFTHHYLKNDPDADAPFLLKIDHTLRVVAHCTRLCDGLPGDVRLAASLAALYHDIGRFPQFEEFGTFHDAHSINHAQRSVDVLKEEGFLPETLPYRNAIITAIRLHNRKSLDQPLSVRDAFFYHLLRDCDKIDVLSVLKGHYQSAGDRDRYLTLGLGNEDRISPTVLNSLKTGNIVDITDVRTRHDFKLLQIGWMYDIHFLESYRFVLSRRDFQDILSTIPARLMPHDFLDSFEKLLLDETEKKTSIFQAARDAGLNPESRLN